tara:strand:- start:1621 stop:2067 length:447 start_codon:yes stop_codon:yes gene_type:complete
MEGLFEIIFQNDGTIFKVAQYILLTGGFLFALGFGLFVLLGIFSIFTDAKDEGVFTDAKDEGVETGIDEKMMGYGLALIFIPLVLCIIASILFIIYKIFTSATVLSWLLYPFIWLYNVLTNIPIIYYFLTAIVILLIAILFKLSGRRE